MTALTNRGEDLVADFLTRTGTRTLGLLTGVTDAEAGTVTECAYTGYARQDITSSFPASSGGGGVDNNAEIAFPEKTGGADETVTHWGIHDGTGWILVEAVTTSKLIEDGDVPRFQAGDLTVTPA